MSDCKCKKCQNQIGKNSNSICCDSCYKWFHFKCSNLSKTNFDFHVQNELEYWRCDYCVPYICKCKRIVKHNQNSIFCNICATWIHLKCSGLNKKEFTELLNSESDWYCRGCIADNLPFCNLDNKKMINMFKINKVITVPTNAIPLCRVCDKSNIIRPGVDKSRTYVRNVCQVLLFVLQCT